MKIVLFAFTNWGLEALKTLIHSNHQISHVYTHPLDMDKNEKVWFESISKICKENNLSFEEKTKLDEKDEKLIKSINPDLIISANWRRLIPESIFQIPKHGSINIHAGFLPKYRGFAPINWAIINGEKEIGVTVHYIDKTADTGDILNQKIIPITIEETATDIYNKALLLLPDLITETITMIESNKLKPVNQKNMKGFLCVKRFPEDSKIDWSQDRLSIYNLIRALSDPFPNAFCNLNNETIFVKKAKLIEDDYRGPPGRICNIDDNGIVVTCGKNHKENQALLLTKIANNEGDIIPKEYFKKKWMRLD